MTSTASLTFERLGATFMLLWVGAVYYLLARSSFQYGQIFQAVEELPWITQVLLHSATYSIVPAVSLVSYVLYWFGMPYSRTIQTICALSTLAAIPLFIVGMYLPIFELVQPAEQ